MHDSLADVIRLLRLAQAGQPEQALVRADESLASADSLEMLYVRAVALHCLGDHDGAVTTAELMLDITAQRVAPTSLTTVGATTTGSWTPELSRIETAPITSGAEAETAGWQSIALSFRATQHMLLSCVPSGHPGLISQDIPDSGRRFDGVESPPGNHRRCPGEPAGQRGRR